MKITALENFHRMMGRDNPAWLPLYITATPPIADVLEKKLGHRNPNDAFGLDFAAVAEHAPDDEELWKQAYEQLGFSLPEETDYHAYGVIFKCPPPETIGDAYHMREWLHPVSVVREVKQLEQLPWPNMQSPALYEHLVREVSDIHAIGRAALGSNACSCFEFAWYVRGMDNIYMDLAEKNGIADWLLDWYTQRTCEVSKQYCKAGVDVIQLGDDVGTQRGMMMSPDYWREHLKPRLQRIIDTIRAAQTQTTYIFYHSDGDIQPIIGELAQMGIDILNPVQPECMPVDEVIAQHKHHIAFWGMVGTQTTMPFGSPDDVRKVVADCARWAKQGAAIIVAPTHVLEPDVPWENIEALVDAVGRTQFDLHLS